jgi:hypothetical protein
LGKSHWLPYHFGKKVNSKSIEAGNYRLQIVASALLAFPTFASAFHLTVVPISVGKNFAITLSSGIASLFRRASTQKRKHRIELGFDLNTGLDNLGNFTASPFVKTRVISIV